MRSVLAQIALLALASCGAPQAAQTAANQSAAAAPQPTPTAPARARLVADAATIAPGQTFRVGVLVEMNPGWHVYWKYPGDAGLPTSVTFSVPDGFEVGKVAWPAPSSFEQPGEIEGYGYEGSALLAADVTAPATLAPGSRVELHAEARWLCCSDRCVPGQAQLLLLLPVRGATASTERALFDAWRARIPAAKGPLSTSVTGTLADSGRSHFVVDVDWSAPVSAVEWAPAPGPLLAVSDVSYTTEGTKTSVRFTAEPLRGDASSQTSPETSLDSVVVFTDNAGRRRAVELPVPLRQAGS